MNGHSSKIIVYITRGANRSLIFILHHNTIPILRTNHIHSLPSSCFLLSHIHYRTSCYIIPYLITIVIHRHLFRSILIPFSAFLSPISYHKSV